MGEGGSREQDHARALERLPTAYAVALRLRDAGASDETIAEALGVDVLSLPVLLELAEAKLAAIEKRLGPGAR